MMNRDNRIMQQFSMMVRQGWSNPQAYVNELLRKNPEFAKQIQGQNVRQMAMQALEGMGMDPNMFFQNPGMLIGMMGNRI